MERALGGLERRFWHLGRTGSAAVVAVAHLDQPPDEEELREAVARAQQRHAGLRVRVVDHETGLRFSPCEAPLPLRVGPAPADLADPIDSEMAAPFPEEGPLARFTLLRGAGGNALLLAFHHSIGDAAGAHALLAEVLGSPAEAQALPPPPPAHALLAPPGRRRSSAARAAERARMLAAGLRGRSRWVPEAPAPPPQRRPRVVRAALDAPDVEALLVRCRAEGTTLQGALAAAALDAARAALPGEGPLPLLHSSAVNLRAAFAVPPADALGCYATTVTTLHHVPARGFWDLARATRKALARALDEEEPARATLTEERRAPRRDDPPGTAALVERMERLLPAGTGVTNLGRVPDGGMQGFEFAPAVLAGVPVVVAAVTHRGRLSVDVVHAEPLVGRVRATRFRDHLMEALHAAKAADRSL